MPKNLKKGILWDFLTFVLLQDTKKRGGGPFDDIKKIFEKNEKGVFKNFSKKKQKNEKFLWQSHSAEKSETGPSGFFTIRSVAKYQTK